MGENEAQYAETSCSALIALKGDPSDVKADIKNVLLADGEACFKEMRPRIFAPGIDGNPHYDHAKGVDVFLKHDSKHGGKVTLWIHEQKLRNPALWNMIARVIRSFGWEMRNGYVVGIDQKLEDMRKQQAA